MRWLCCIQPHSVFIYQVVNCCICLIWLWGFDQNPCIKMNTRIRLRKNERNISHALNQHQYIYVCACAVYVFLWVQIDYTKNGKFFTLFRSSENDCKNADQNEMHTNGMRLLTWHCDGNKLLENKIAHIERVYTWWSKSARDEPNHSNLPIHT